MPEGARQTAELRIGWVAAGALLRAGLSACVCMALLGLQSACTPGPPTPAKPPVNPPSVVLTQAFALENTGRPNPARALPLAVALIEQAEPGSADQLEVLTIAANFAALAHDVGMVSELSAKLRRWPNAQLAGRALMADAVLRAAERNSAGDSHQSLKILGAISNKAIEQEPLNSRIRLQRALAVALMNNGQAELGIAAFHRTLRDAELRGVNWQIARAYVNLASAYGEIRQVERSRAMLAQAEAMLQKENMPFERYSVTLMHGVLASLVKDTTQDVRYTEQALQLAREMDSPDNEALALANLADYYLRKPDYVQAARYASEGIDLSRKTRNHHAEAIALVNLGLALLHRKQYVQGKALMQQSVDVAVQHGNAGILNGLYADIAAALEAEQLFADAYQAYKRARDIEEAQFKRKAREAILESQEQFDAQRRARDIELLNRDNHLKAEKIEHQSLQMKLWALLATCIVVSCGLLFMLYQRVRKVNHDLASSNATLKTQGERDPLTGLSNRRHFQTTIKQRELLGRVEGTLFLIDIDHFKHINDLQGHAAGDAVLVEVAARLQRAVRAHDLVVRWGGEEFLILVQSRDSAAVRALAQRLLDSLARPPALQHGGQTLTVTASIGFASFPVSPQEFSVSLEQAIGLIDLVMYLAKAHGRNRAYGINSVRAKDEQELLLIMSDLEAAWHDGRIDMTALQGPILP